MKILIPLTLILLTSCTNLQVDFIAYQDTTKGLDYPNRNVKNTGFPFIGQSFILHPELEVITQVGISKPEDWKGAISDWIGRTYLHYKLPNNLFIDLGTFYQFTNDYKAHQPSIDKSGHRLDHFVGLGYFWNKTISTSITYTERTKQTLISIGFRL